MLRISRGCFLKRMPSLPSGKFLSLSTIPQRNYSSSTSNPNASATDGSIEKKDTAQTEDIKGGTTSSKLSSNTIPWYLSMVDRAESQNESTIKREEIQFPKNCPEALIKITEYLRDKLGLTNILLFDLRDREEKNFTTAVAKISDFMVIGTAKSAKHCQKSFVLLNSLMKQEYDSVACVEGNINAKDEKKRQKRLARKANLSKAWGSNSSSNSIAFQNNSEAWFMIDCHVDNIFVNIVTEKRRHELNLEELYAPEDQRAKYQRQDAELEPESQEDINEVSSENNVLAGLRRLAYQRRQYSTRVPYKELCGQLSKSLDEENFLAARNMIEGSNVRVADDSKSLALPFMQTITDSFAKLEISLNKKKIKVNQWRNLFELCWPLVLPQSSAPMYWSLRLEFLKMLNLANAKAYPCDSFIGDYLLAKKSLGFTLNKEDLLQFLKIVINNLNSKTDANYWDLVHNNGDVTNALKLFEDVNGSNIVDDELVVSMLLKTMVLNDDKRTRLHSLYEVIDHIVTTKEGKLTPNMMSIVLEILGDIKDWNKFLQFWEVGIKGVVPGQDYRPWSQFIRIVVESNDFSFMQKIINEGHLLWLKRHEVEMSEEIELQLTRLFERVDPKDVAFTQLKSFICM